MWQWLVNAGKWVATVFKTVAQWAYNHPIVALLVGGATYLLTNWIREGTRQWGYVPVITELGAVASFLSSAFQYAIVTGVLSEHVVETVKGWLSEAYDFIRGAGDGVWHVFNNLGRDLGRSYITRLGAGG